MPGFLDQIVDKERQLLRAKGQRHPVDERRKFPRLVSTKKAAPIISAEIVSSIPAPTPAEVAVTIVPPPMSEPVLVRMPEAAAEPAERLQTVGLHKVPTSLVDALKAEAKRRSVNGKKVSLTEVALQCIRVGLSELMKIAV